MSSWNFDGRGHLSIIDDEGAGCWEGEVGGVDDVEGPVIEGVDIAMLALHARCQEG